MNPSVEQLRKDIAALRQELDSKEKLLQEIQLTEAVNTTENHNNTPKLIKNVQWFPDHRQLRTHRTQ